MKSIKAKTFKGSRLSRVGGNLLASMTIYVLTPIFYLIVTSCEDFVEIDPPQTEITRETIFSSDESATAAINGLYAISSTFLTMLGTELSMVNGHLSDEFNFLGTWNELYLEGNLNDVVPNNTQVLSLWTTTYNSIYNANSLIEGLEGNDQITSDLRDQLLGEAYFIRAFMHFNLANFFGDVPYVESTDVESNNSIGRTSIQEVNERVLEDLETAQSLMMDNNDLFGSERFRSTRQAATALLSRVYLYVEDWSNAELQASSIIEQTELFQLEADLNVVFTAGSNEAIFQLGSENRGIIGITPLSNLFIIDTTPRTFILASSEVSDRLINIFSPGDIRLINWVDTFTNSSGSWNFINKYKNSNDVLVGPPEYTTLLRLAEQYLIRSEARARNNNIAGALEDLNRIRNRSGLADTTLSDRPAVIGAIMLERQRELFGEGHRWFDLKRTGLADEVLAPIKEGWQPTDVLLPIPEQEILNNSNLGPQNPGY